MPIQLTDLTNGSTKREAGTQPVWEGTAIFDVLMKAVNENINIQFEQNRITGSDYATVYLGAIETCIKEATNLLLQKAVADKEIEVKQAQILQIQASILNTQEDTKLKTAQIATEQEEKKLKAAQALAFPLQSAKDLDYKQAQINVAIEEKRLKSAQVDAYPLQSAKDLELKTAQINVALEETKLKAAQAIAYPLQSAKDLEVKQAQINIALEEKKLKSAQVDAYPDQAAKDLLVKQANIDLLNRQKEGFDDNKYQKLFEAQMSAWALMFSSGLLTTQPSIISNDSASSLYNTLKPK